MATAGAVFTGACVCAGVIATKEELGNIQAKGLVMHGALDEMVTLRQFDEFKHAVPGAATYMYACIPFVITLGAVINSLCRLCCAVSQMANTTSTSWNGWISTSSSLISLVGHWKKQSRGHV